MSADFGVTSVSATSLCFYCMHLFGSSQELEGWLYIGELTNRSHFWTSQTMLEYLGFLAGELRARRRDLGLSLGDRALVLCDHASQHSWAKYRKFKEEWSRQHNVVPRHSK